MRFDIEISQNCMKLSMAEKKKNRKSADFLNSTSFTNL